MWRTYKVKVIADKKDIYNIGKEYEMIKYDGEYAYFRNIEMAEDFYIELYESGYDCEMNYKAFKKYGRK